MNISKDQSIIMQVAAKIASELTPKSDDANTNITTFADVYDAVCDIILTSQGMSTSSTPTAPTAPAVSTPQQMAQEEAMIVKAFPDATPVQAPPVASRCVSRANSMVQSLNGLTRLAPLKA